MSWKYREKKANRKQMKRRILKPVVGYDEFYPKSLYPNLLNLWMDERKLTRSWVLTELRTLGIFRERKWSPNVIPLSQ